MSARTSLRFRLMASNILTKQVVILLAGLFLLEAFNRLIYRQAGGELDAVVNELAASIEQDANGRITMPSGLTDARFRQPFSGWYWQVTNGTTLLKSMSLGDAKITLPQDRPVGPLIQNFETKGPADQQLYVSARSVVPKGPVSGAPAAQAVVTVGRDTAGLASLAREFRNDLILTLGGIAALLLTSAWFQMKIGLRAAETLRTAIERVRMGLDRRLGTGFPDELQLLIAEANSLLDSQDAAIAKARARAGDLAHGLKTPLTAVGMLAERLRDDGEFEISEAILEQVDSARRHIERELARTRIAAEHRSGFQTDFHTVAHRVVRTMEKLPRGDEICWRLDSGTAINMAIDETDFVEILGNLLDNSRKWARSNVGLRALYQAHAVEIMIEDDGPGVAVDGYDYVLRRGKRLDESSPGTGLGLTIVKDIVEAYGGSIDLYRAHLGGLGVRLTLPRAAGKLH